MWVGARPKLIELEHYGIFTTTFWHMGCVTIAVFRTCANSYADWIIPILASDKYQSEGWVSWLVRHSTVNTLRKRNSVDLVGGFNPRLILWQEELTSTVKIKRNEETISNYQLFHEWASFPIRILLFYFNVMFWHVAPPQTPPHGYT